MRRVVAPLAIVIALQSPGLASLPEACRLLTDRPGDDAVSMLAPPSPATHDPSLDLLSADISSSRDHVVAVVRVDRAGWAVSTGRSWSVDFTLNGELDVRASAYSMVEGDQFSVAAGKRVDSAVTDNLENLGPVTGKVDLPRGRIEIFIPMKLVGAHLDERVLMTAASSGRAHSALGLIPGSNPRGSLIADTASGSGRYTLGARSCVQRGL